MDAERLAIIIADRLVRHGHLRSNRFGEAISTAGPILTIERAILKRVAFGDVVLIPDEEERAEGK